MLVTEPVEGFRVLEDEGLRDLAWEDYAGNIPQVGELRWVRFLGDDGDILSLPQHWPSPRMHNAVENVS